MWKYLFSCLTIFLLHVNGNSVKKKSAVVLDICTLQPDWGAPCTNYSTRFYYNSRHKICLNLDYGGCGGNPNNFKSMEECKKHCPGKYTELQRPLYCMKVPDRGNCKKSYSRFYYNSESNKCESFEYSGCGGNENRFDDIRECRMECVVHEFTLQLKSN